MPDPSLASLYYARYQRQLARRRHRNRNRFAEYIRKRGQMRLWE